MFAGHVLLCQRSWPPTDCHRCGGACAAAPMRACAPHCLKLILAPPPNVLKPRLFPLRLAKVQRSYTRMGSPVRVLRSGVQVGGPACTRLTGTPPLSV